MTEENNNKSSRKWCWIGILIVIICSVIIRGRLVSMPLERDEGEYAYIGQQMLKGVPPYVSAYSMKLPGIYGVYAGIMTVFGQTISGIHWGLIVFNSVTIFIIFLITRRLFGNLAGVAAGAAYAILSLTSSSLGLTANSEHFVLLPALIGCLLILIAIEHNSALNIFISALFFGLAFIIKQHGILFAGFAALYLLYWNLRQKQVKWGKLILNQIIFAAGAIIPFVIICLIYRQMGVFDKFWFWTFTYARQYTSAVPIEVGWWLLKEKISEIISQSILIWLAVFAGVVRVFVSKEARKNIFFVICFLIFSFLAVCPGLYFRSHYFLFFFPAVSICAGLGFDWVCKLIAFKQNKKPYMSISAIAGAILIFAGISIYQQKTYLFENKPIQVCRMFYGGNPFPEAVEIGKYIKDNSDPNDKIAIMGSEPEIFFYSERLSAAPYIYVYPLMETNKFAVQLQKEMISDLEKAKPEWFIFVHVQYSWLMRPESNLDILKWTDEYMKNFYQVQGIFDIKPDWTTVTVWGPKARNYSMTSDDWVAVYKRQH